MPTSALRHHCRALAFALAAGTALGVASYAPAAQAKARVEVRPFSRGFERVFERDAEGGLEAGTLPGVQVGLELPTSTRIGVGAVASVGHFQHMDEVPGALTPVKMGVVGYGGLMVEQELLGVPDLNLEAWFELMVGGAVRCQRDAPLGEGLCPYMEAVPVVETVATIMLTPTPGVRLSSSVGWRQHLHTPASSAALAEQWTGEELSGFSARLRLSIDL